jgi:hypothetical protein
MSQQPRSGIRGAGVFVPHDRRARKPHITYEHHAGAMIKVGATNGGEGVGQFFWGQEFFGFWMSCCVHWKFAALGGGGGGTPTLSKLGLFFRKEQVWSLFGER